MITVSEIEEELNSLIKDWEITVEQEVEYDEGYLDALRDFQYWLKLQIEEDIIND